MTLVDLNVLLAAPVTYQPKTTDYTDLLSTAFNDVFFTNNYVNRTTFAKNKLE